MKIKRIIYECFDDAPNLLHNETRFLAMLTFVISEIKSNSANGGISLILTHLFDYSEEYTGRKKYVR